MSETPCFIRSQSAEETHRLGAALAPWLKPGDVVILSGDLGAGKTQFVQGVAEGLSISELPCSPTFTILMDYEGRLPLHHFDLYRLESADQLEDVGLFDALEDGGVSFIEWGAKFLEDLPEDHLELVMESDGPTERRWLLKPRGRRGEELAREWAASL